MAGLGLVWLGATLGVVAWQGELPALLAGLMPGLAQGAPMVAALMLFLGGAAGLLVLAYGAVALSQAGRGQGRPRGT